MRFQHRSKILVAAFCLFLLICSFSISAQAESSAAEIKAQMEGIKQLITSSKITYFTKNGAACSTHNSGGSCDNCMIKNMIPNAPTGLYTGAQAYSFDKSSCWTCVGYAKWMFYNLFEHMPYDNTATWINIKDARPGDYVALNGHAGIFYAWADTAKTKFYMYDGNHSDFKIHFADLVFNTDQVKEVLRSPKNVRAIVPALSAGVQNIVARAYQQVNMEWKPVKDVKAWGSTVFKAGTTYKGLPYGQPYDAGRYIPFNANFETFLNAVLDGGSNFYRYRGAGGGDSPYYANDCSAFVSYCYNLERHTTTTLSTLSELTTISSLAKAEIGDCLVKSGVHVILITNIYTKNGVKYITICHQTPPQAVEETFTESAFTAKYLNNGYIIRRLKNRDNVPAPVTVTIPQTGALTVSARLDGTAMSDLGAFGTFDITVGSDVRNDVNTYKNSSVKSGTKYSITDIKAAAGYEYLGVQSGSTTGTIAVNKSTGVVLNFATQGHLVVEGNLDGIVDSSIEHYGTFDVYINGQLDASNCTDYHKQWPDGTTYEIRNIKAASGKNYDGTAKFSGTIRSNTESKVVLPYSSDGTASTEWQTGKVLPGNLNPDELDIQYEHTYVQTGRTSPGTDWEMVEAGPVQYENDGAAYNSDNQLTTSATRVQAGYYYFHWCGNPNDKQHANYFQRPGLLDKYHTIPANQVGNYAIASQSLDGDRYFYTFTNLTGEWAGALTTCPSGCKYYYKGYVYQNKKAYQINTYQKTTGWTDVLDTTASSYSVRWRYKDGFLPDAPKTYTLTIDGQLDGAQATDIQGYATFDLYVDGKLYAQNCTGISTTFTHNIAYSIENIQPALGKKYEGVVSGTVSGETSAGKTKVTLSFVTVIDIGEGWTEVDSLPSDLDLSGCQVEYRNHYVTTGRTSPGENWTLIAEGALQYENDGAQYESDNEKATSATCVLVGYYYFHWCNNGTNANYYKKDYLPIRHVIPLSSMGDFTVKEMGTDGDGSGRKYYYLTHRTGPYAGGTAKCGTSGTPVYYRGGVYQNKKAYRINTYSMIGEWTTAADPAAASVEYRIRRNQYDVTLAGNGCSYSEKLSKLHDMALDLSAYIPKREGYAFAGWNTAADGSGEQIMIGTAYTANESTTLYAQWRIPLVTTLPSGLKVIDEEAFAGSSVMIVHIPVGCESIQARSFAGCKYLDKIYIPSTVTYISESAFDNIASLVIVGDANSAAEAFSSKHSWITFITAE